MDKGQLGHAGMSLLTAIGVMAPPDVFVGGLFLAASAGYFINAMIPYLPKPFAIQKKGPAVALIIAVFVSLFFAIIHDAFFSSWPLPALMMLSGACSQFILIFGMSVLGRLTGRSIDIADAGIDKVTKD